MSQLTELNKDIEQRLLRVNLFVELNDNEEYYNQIYQALEYARNHTQLSPQKIARNFPFVVGYFMVLHGMFHYRGGHFWQDSLNLDPNQRTVWSQVFLNTLSNYGMPRFDAIIEEEAAQRNITPILMHGGIPRHSLPDYFREFLVRYLRVVKRSNISLAQFKQDWLEQFHQVDKPIIRFLKYGGSFAQNWIERTVQMAILVDEFIRRNRLESVLSQAVISESRMPTWVTQAYWEYRKATRVREKNGVLISAPRLSLDDHQTVIIDFLNQEVAIGTDNALAWVVEAGSAEQRTTTKIPLFTHIRGNLVHVEATSINLDCVDDLFGLRILLYQGPTVLKTWSYDYTIVIFQQRGNQYILQHRKDGKLPNAKVQLVTALPVNLMIDDEYIEPMQDREACVYRFDAAACTTVICNDKPLVFAESDDDLTPFLVDGQKSALIQPIDSASTYLTLPTIQVPLSRNSSGSEQLKNWRMVIVNETTGKIIGKPEKLAQYVNAISMYERHMCVSLATVNVAWVPGLYRIELSSDTQSKPLYFYYVPDFVVAEQTPLIVPIKKSLKPKIVITSLPAGWQCVDRDNTAQMTITFPEGTESAVCNLHDGTYTMHIPVVFPHLHLALLDKSGDEIVLNSTYQKDTVWYQENLPIIEARLAPWNAPDMPNLHVEVSVDVAQNDVNHVLAVRSNAARRWFMCDSAGASDTIMHSLGGNAQINVTISQTHMQVTIPIVTLQKMVIVDNLRLSWAPVLEKFRVSADWDKPTSPSNWKLVFWSLQRPWQSAVLRPLSNDALSAKYIVSQDDFRGGEAYLVGIVSVNNEYDVASAFPPESEGYCTFVVPGTTTGTTAEDLIAALFAGIQPNIVALSQLFEKPCSDVETRIKINYRLLLRIHQTVVHAFRSDAQQRIKKIITPELKSLLGRFYNRDKFAFLIAILKLEREMRQYTVFTRELVQYLAHEVHLHLFEVLLKSEIRRGACASHYEAFLQRNLTDSDIQLLRKHHFMFIEEYDELFVEIGVTDKHYRHGILREMIDDSWIGSMNAPQEIQYEDAVLATSRFTGNHASVLHVHTLKNDCIKHWREALMPIIQVWLLRTAISANRPLGAIPSRWWAEYAQLLVLQKLNEYTPEQGDLRDYLEVAVMPKGTR
jgi:hypothetical protein